jgi:hypothetical protein
VRKIASRIGNDPSLIGDRHKRAAAAAAGRRVVPLLPNESTVGALAAREAGIARVPLLVRLDGGARQRQPLLAAMAQVISIIGSRLCSAFLTRRNAIGASILPLRRRATALGGGVGEVGGAAGGLGDAAVGRGRWLGFGR